MNETHTPANVTLGSGASVHVGYFVDENLCGSLCDRSAYMSKRVRLIDAPATCTRCARVAASESDIAKSTR